MRAFKFVRLSDVGSVGVTGIASRPENGRAVLLTVMLKISLTIGPTIRRFYRAHFPLASKRLHANRQRRVRAGPAFSVRLHANGAPSVRRPSDRRQHQARPGYVNDLQSCTNSCQATRTAPISAWSAPPAQTSIRTTQYCR